MSTLSKVIVFCALVVLGLACVLLWRLFESLSSRELVAESQLKSIHSRLLESNGRIDQLDRLLKSQQELHPVAVRESVGADNPNSLDELRQLVHELQARMEKLQAVANESDLVAVQRAAVASASWTLAAGDSAAFIDEHSLLSVSDVCRKYGRPFRVCNRETSIVLFFRNEADGGGFYLDVDLAGVRDAAAGTQAEFEMWLKRMLPEGDKR